MVERKYLRDSKGTKNWWAADRYWPLLTDFDRHWPLLTDIGRYCLENVMNFLAKFVDFLYLCIEINEDDDDEMVNGKW